MAIAWDFGLQRPSRGRSGRYRDRAGPRFVGGALAAYRGDYALAVMAVSTSTTQTAAIGVGAFLSRKG
jgi:hypothetical protein